MAQSATDDHAENGDGRVGVTFAGQNELTQRTAAEQAAAPTDDRHAEHVPQPFGVSNGLTLHAEGQAVAEDQVAAHDGDDDANETCEQAKFSEHDCVTKTANHAKTASLCQCADNQRNDKGDVPRCILGAGAGQRGSEQSDGNRCDEQADHDDRECQTVSLGLLVSAAEGEALLQEDDADKDAEDEADEAHDGIHVAAADTDDHTQWAAEEDQRAHHDDDAKEETGEGGAAALGLKLLADESHDAGAGDDADDFRTEVGDDARSIFSGGTGGLQAHRACDVAQEASDAEAHVLGVALAGQEHSRCTDEQAAKHDEPIAFEEIVFFHFYLL